MKTFDDSTYRNKSGHIYLIQAKGTRRFKIGLTTRSVEARLAELNSSQSPYPLQLIKVVSTGNVTETEGFLHKRFAGLRRHGEWFEFDGRQLNEVIREYDRLSNGGRRWFEFPTFPALNLPNLEWLLKSDMNTKGLMLAGMGAFWLMVGFIGCEPQRPLAKQVTHTQQHPELQSRKLNTPRKHERRTDRRADTNSLKYRK